MNISNRINKAAEQLPTNSKPVLKAAAVGLAAAAGAAAGPVGALAAGAAASAAVNAASSHKGPSDEVTVKNQKGTSQLRFTDIEGEKKAWAGAANGTQVPEIQFRTQQGIEATNAIYDHLNQKGDLSPEQWDNVADFMQDIMNHGSVDNKKWDQMSLKDVLNEGVAEFGITEEQIKLVADGDFSSEAYISMVGDGKSIG